jgi:hypothetical protein
MTISEEIIKELIHFFHSFSLFMSSLCPAYVQLMSESGHQFLKRGGYVFQEVEILWDSVNYGLKKFYFSILLI